MVACKAYSQSSSGSKVCFLKATMMASCATVSTVETGVGPIAAYVVVVRLRHLATVLGLMPWRAASVCRLS